MKSTPDRPWPIPGALPELRSIPTRDAELFVPWNAGCVRQVLRQRNITADDFDVGAPRLKAFVHALVPLAAQDSLAGVPDTRLACLARALLRRLHGGLDATPKPAAEAPGHG